MKDNTQGDMTEYPDIKRRLFNSLSYESSIAFNKTSYPPNAV